ncbi:hypothetical protein KA047_02155 [Candidatus Saccharibacteria bacterium]|nr:hypothetical protein [Candidatus Saccharibacteria bacterium]
MSGPEKPVSEWKLDHPFEDKAGNRITCDKDAECTMGWYIIEEYASGEVGSPACQTCDFSTSLTCVFNPNEANYDPGASEDFKLAAARVMMDSFSDTALEVMRFARPDTIAAMEQTIADAEQNTP